MTDLAGILGVVATLVDIADPALGVVARVLTGVAAAEPTAVALYRQLTSGTPPTAAQLQAYAAGYEAAYVKLGSDIAAA